MQSLYDQTQMLDQHQIVKHMNENNGDVNKNRIFLKTLDLMGKKVKNSLNVADTSFSSPSSIGPSFFVPACVTHMIFTRR